MNKVLLSLALSLLFAGCNEAVPPLSESAQRTLEAPVPTSEAQRVWECAGTSGTIKGLKFVLKLQGRPENSDGEVWATQERAKRLGCTQAEMDARDKGNFSSPPVSPRPK